MGLRVSVLCVGRSDGLYEAPIRDLEAMIRVWATLEIRHVRPPGAQDGSPGALGREADLLRRALPERAWTVALTPEGRQLDTPGFARWLDTRARAALPVAFLIGGAWGLDPLLKKECRETLSLSRLTLSHRVALLTLVEQVYRALTILNGHPYHK